VPVLVVDGRGISREGFGLLLLAADGEPNNTFDAMLIVEVRNIAV
jgi:hypothetical protein